MMNEQLEPQAKKTASYESDLWALEPALRVHAMRLTRCLHEADDLVQDTLERALRYRVQFRAGTNLSGWVHRIMQNQFISERRRRARERRSLQTMGQDPTWRENPLGNPSACLGLTKGTMRAMDSLPLHYRLTLQLVVLEDMTYQEAAQRMQVPVGTVMSRLHRARRRFAEHLAHDFAGQSPERLAA